MSNKNDARKALVENARLLSNIIYGQGLPDGDLLELGLTVKKQPTPQPAPQQAPDLDFIGVAGSKLRLRVHNNETVSRRRMPEGVTGSWVWSFVGPVPPLDFQQWKWEGSFTRRVVTLDFGMEVEPGMKVWVTAAWINRKGQLGPVASPLEARLPGLVQNAAAQGGDGPSTNETFMKVA